MAMKGDLAIWAVVGILAFAVFGGQGAAPSGTGSSSSGGVDLCTVVQPSASFTGQRMFLEGTSITSEYVRVIKSNGMNKDLGYKQLNSATLNTDPNGAYKLYWAVNSSTYYGVPEAYTAPCKDAVDDKVGSLCTIDTAPSIKVYNEDGDVNTAQAVGADDTRNINVKVRVAADKCYGNPSAAVSGTNAICFKYNTTVFKKISAGTAIATPYTVSSTNSTSGYDIACFALDKIKDNAEITVAVKLESQSTEPTLLHNMSVFLDDVAMDLNQDTLDQINGFVDEDNNALGASVVQGTILLS
jgi:hypothetical protein